MCYIIVTWGGLATTVDIIVHNNSCCNKRLAAPICILQWLPSVASSARDVMMPAVRHWANCCCCCCWRRPSTLPLCHPQLSSWMYFIIHFRDVHGSIFCDPTRPVQTRQISDPTNSLWRQKMNFQNTLRH